VSWLSALDTISGPRWSAGAVWGTSEWADSSTWDAAHEYDPDADLSLGVFIEGVDVTDAVRSVNWSVGKSDPLTVGLQVGSAQVELQEYEGGFDSAGFAYEGFEPIDGTIQPSLKSRVVVLTEWNGLFIGTVESSTLSEAPGQLASVSVDCVDDLANTIGEVEQYPAGGYLFWTLDQCLQKAGVVGKSWTRAPGDQTRPYDFEDPGGTPHGYKAYVLDKADTGELINTEYTGTIIGILGQMLWECGMAGAWTPYGLRVHQLSLTAGDDINHRFADAFMEGWSQLASRSRMRSIDNLYNHFTLEAYDDTYQHDDLASQALYGRRDLQVTADYRYDDSEPLEDVWYPVIYGKDPSDGSQQFPKYSEPVTTMTLEANVTTDRHRLTQALPFDYIYDADPGADTEVWRVLRVQHSVSVDSWRVSAETIRCET